MLQVSSLAPFLQRASASSDRILPETESWIQTAHRPSRRIARVGRKPDDAADSDDDKDVNNNNDKQVSKITSVSGKQRVGGDTEAALMLMLKQIQEQVVKLGQSKATDQIGQAEFRNWL